MPERAVTAVREHRRGPLRWLAADLLERQGVRHGFTLRGGGASLGSFASLNFSSRDGDRAERVRENWRRLAAAAGIPTRGWALLSQVHGARVERVRAGAAACHHRRYHPEADAMAADVPGIALGVLTADCLPIVFGAPGGSAVAIAHAGWRGTLEGVAPAAVRELCRLSGAPPADLVAALGPAIGRCCYQVGEEVRETFRGRWGGDFARRVFARADPWRLDLQAANLIQLREAGIASRGVSRIPLCTSCRPDLFFSYRRDGRRSGRMLSFVLSGAAGGVTGSRAPGARSGGWKADPSPRTAARAPGRCGTR